MSDDDDLRQPTEIAGLELPDAPKEEATERDGLLSYAGEWHALVIGLVVGTVATLTGHYVLMVVVVGAALGLSLGRRCGTTRRVPALGEIRREPWYALFGLILGAMPVVLL